jgi:hypothetical protein
VTLIEGGWVQAGSEFAFRVQESETVATFETPYVSRSSDNAILTFEYDLIGGQSPTLKVFAHCDGSSTPIDLGQGGTEFLLEEPVSEYTSQCLAVQYFIQEANTSCDLFKIVFEGSSTPSAEPSVNVQNIKFRSSDVVGQATANCVVRNNR